MPYGGPRRRVNYRWGPSSRRPGRRSPAVLVETRGEPWGWRDRDYSQDTWTERGSAGPSFKWPQRGAFVLIGLHVAAFVLVQVLASEGAESLMGVLAISESVAHPVGILLHPLATRDLLTLVLTVLIIWTLGSRIEQQDGRRQMLSLYLTGNILAGLAFFGLARLWSPLAAVELDYPAGALAAWCLAAYWMAANEMVVLFGRLRKVSHLVGIGLVVVVGLMFAFRGLGAVGWLGALAAGACGQPLLQRLPLAGVRGPRRRRPAVRPSTPREPPPERTADAEAEIDAILAKISRSGINSLTRAERAQLEAARQAKLRQSSHL